MRLVLKFDELLENSLLLLGRNAVEDPPGQIGDFARR